MESDTAFDPRALVAWFEDRFVPFHEVAVPCWDYGFTMGVAITEQLRTYDGKLPLLDRHLNRFAAGASAIDIQIDRQRLAYLIQETVQRNQSGSPTATEFGGEFSVNVVVTAGDHAARLPHPAGSHTQGIGRSLIGHRLLITAIPLQNHWQEMAQTGVKLVAVNRPEIPAACLPKQLKCRSRMHYYLAEREASRLRPGSLALMRDVKGCYLEGTTASLVLSIEGHLVAPPAADVLPSISVEVLQEVISPKLGLPFQRRPIDQITLASADAWYWLSTPFAILPVSEIAILEQAEQPILIQREPGKQYGDLLAAWRDQIGWPW